MAAVRLARAGASVTLFDPSHPREKPCGGGLTGRALALVSDVIDIHSLPAVVVEVGDGRRPRAQRARSRSIDRGATPDSSLLVVSRAVFDRALADAAVAAGARLVPEKAVTSLRRQARMTVRTDRREYEIDQVLGADGANSVVRKKLARPFARARTLGGRGLLRPRPVDCRASPSRRRRPARISVVVSPARSSCGRHLCPGRPPCHVRRPPRAVGSMDPAARPPSGHDAHAVRMAHSEHRVPASTRGRAGRRRMDAARRRGRAGRSADARRHLLSRCCRASGRPMRSRPPAGARPRLRGTLTGC